MEEQAKVLSFKLVESEVIISVDPNKDGQPVLKISMPMTEVFDELSALLGMIKK